MQSGEPDRSVETSAEPSRNEEGPDLGFTYRVRKNGEIEIRQWGQRAAILRGMEAIDFLAKTEGDFAATQQAMARLTGHYKRGNERVARRHPRNRR